MPPKQPTKLGKYVIKSPLGKGAMGVVYLAEDQRLGRPVALKTMSPSVADDPELLQRFYREAQSAGQLRHPNIVTIYDIDEADGVPFIAMEFLEGESLESVIAARKELPVVRKVEILAQTCKGLHYAHEHGIVHRDVKPANIVVLTDGMVKIVDFGIARIAGGSMTRTGLVMGTPMYMSPEQVLGQQVDARSDIFSAGVILYELLTFQNPFGGGDIPSILYKIVEKRPEPLSSLLPNCPPQLDNVIMKALARDREERYQSAEDFAFDLLQVADYLGKHMVTFYVEQGRRSIEEGNLTFAKESLQRVLEIDSNHNVAKALLSKVQEQIYSRQRVQKVEQTLRQAKDALQGEQYEEAILVLDDILRMDPLHEEALQYKQLAVEQRDRIRKIHRHMEAAEKLMSDADLQAAKAQLEAVLALDPRHSAAQALLSSVLREITEQERLRRVRQHTEAAKAQLAEKNYARALELLEAAQQLDPVNIEVESLLRLVRSGQEKEERRKLLEQRLAAIQEALNRERFDEALGQADSALQEFPNHSQVLKLRTQASRQVDAQKKRRFVEEQIQAARGFLEKNQYSSAIALLERALETAPQDARLTAYLKTVRETQEAAELEALRQDAIREAHEHVRAKDFVSAVNTLERALARAGQSPELIEILQFVREQEADYQRQDRMQAILSRAQALLAGEEYAEAYDLLERSQTELQASEISELLTTVRAQWERFERQRGETVQRARQLVQGNEARKAVALLEASPKAYFKDPEFQSLYAACREAFARQTAIKSAVEQTEKAIAAEDLVQAEAVLDHALRSYPGDPSLLAIEKRLKEEVVRVRWALWGKLLDDARVNIGRMKYQQAIRLLGSVDWESAELPDLATQAAALLAEAHRKDEEARRAEEEARRREEEAAMRQTLVRAVPPLRAAASTDGGLMSSQERLREALQRSGRATQEPARPAPGSPAMDPTSATLPGAGPAAAGPVTAPHAKSGAAAPPVTPAVARAPAVAVPAPKKGTPVALWAVVGVIVLAIAGVAAWKHFAGTAAPPGRAQITAVPWAEIVKVQAKDGQSLNIHGYTPMGIELPPGDYLLELKSEQGSESVNVAVKSGETTRVNFTFPGVTVNAVVDELVSRY
ncbi:MAG: protein kinase [Terriglobia bacterium]